MRGRVKVMRARAGVRRLAGGHEASVLLQRFAAWKERRRVSVVSHTKQDQVEDGDLPIQRLANGLLVFSGGLDWVRLSTMR